MIMTASTSADVLPTTRLVDLLCRAPPLQRASNQPRLCADTFLEEQAMLVRDTTRSRSRLLLLLPCIMHNRSQAFLFLLGLCCSVCHTAASYGPVNGLRLCRVVRRVLQTSETTDLSVIQLVSHPYLWDRRTASNGISPRRSVGQSFHNFRTDYEATGLHKSWD